MGGPFAKEDIVEEMDGRRERVHITAASAAYLNMRMQLSQQAADLLGQSELVIMGPK
jgi:hypothetical protein